MAFTHHSTSDLTRQPTRSQHPDHDSSKTDSSSGSLPHPPRSDPCSSLSRLLVTSQHLLYVSTTSWLYLQPGCTTKLTTPFAPTFSFRPSEKGIFAVFACPYATHPLYPSSAKSVNSGGNGPGFYSSGGTSLPVML
jgi:hypothetical protein